MTRDARPWLLSLVLLAATAACLILDGRQLLASSGRVLLWYNNP